jgi:hypothetical protein
LPSYDPSAARNARWTSSFTSASVARSPIRSASLASTARWIS